MPDYEGIKRWIGIGSKMTGSAASVAIATTYISTGGDAAGSFVAPLFAGTLEKIGNDIYQRFLSEQERIRIGGVITYATINIQKKLDNGLMPRNDGFFGIHSVERGACTEIPFVDRPAAEEILEGVLLLSQKEYEEKKIPFLGNLLVNFAFDTRVDRSMANMLIGCVPYLL